MGDGAMKRWLGSARIMPVKIETRVGWCNERMAGAAQAATFLRLKSGRARIFIAKYGGCVIWGNKKNGVQSVTDSGFSLSQIIS